MKRCLLVLVAVVSLPALAQRLSVLDFSGPGGRSARAQLVQAVCSSADCVAQNKVSSRKKPDWKKAKRQRVKLIVDGKVKKAGRRQVLELLLFTGPGKPSGRSTFKVSGGTLPARELARAVELIRYTAGGPEETPPPPPPPPPKDVPPPPPDPVVTPETPEAPPEVVAEAPRRSPRVRRGAPFLVIELGADLLNRNYDYVQASTPNLRRYQLDFFPLPTLRAELYPFSGDSGFTSGLGFEAGVGAAPFLKSRRQNTPDPYPTTALRVDAGARYRFLLGSGGASLAPCVGLRVQGFSVGAASDGSTLDGLPGLLFIGARLGAAVEVPVMDGLLTVLARGSLTPVFASGQVISQAYFPRGSTLGWDASAGVALKVTSFLQLRATLEYTQYNLSFTSDSATDTYVAQGAVDRYLGGNVGLRLVF